MKAMLPIKTKSGLKERHIEVSEDEDEEDHTEAVKVDKPAEEDKQAVVENDISPGDEVSVVELYARRKGILTEQKILIGSLASNFLEIPEE